MAAANTDKLKKYKSLFSTTLSTGIGTGTGDTITPATVTGLPTDTAITLTFDRVDSGGVSTPTKMERIVGVISGGNFTSYVRGVDGTTEQAHSAGAVIEMIWNADDWNDAVDWGLVEHNQDGTHSDVTADSIDIGSTIAVTGVLDEDTMSSNSAVKLATQQSIKAYVDGINTTLTNSINKRALNLYVVDATTDTSTGDGKMYFTIPSYLNTWILKRVHGRVITAGTTGTTDIQLHSVTDAVDMLSTKLTIDSGETGSDTAATAAVIDTANDDVATNDLIRVDIDAVSTTAAKGLILTLEFEDN